MVALTLDQLRESLTNPDFAVAFIIDNNAEAVADKLRQMGFIASDEQGITVALNTMLADGRYNDFISALTVPVDTSKLTPEQLAVVGEMAQAMSRASGQPGQYKSGDGAFNWNALFGGLASGTLAYLQMSGQQSVKPENAIPKDPQGPKDNTLYWVLGIAGGIVLLIVAVLLIKAKKG